VVNRLESHEKQHISISTERIARIRAVYRKDSPRGRKYPPGGSKPADDDSWHLAAAASSPTSAKVTAERRKELLGHGGCGGALTAMAGRTFLPVRVSATMTPGAKTPKTGTITSRSG